MAPLYFGDDDLKEVEKLLAGDRTYSINCAGKTKINCTGWRRISFGVPCVKKTGSGEFSTFKLLMSFVGAEVLSPEQKGATGKEITAVVSYQNKDRVFFIGRLDKILLSDAIACGERCVDGNSIAQSEYAQECARFYRDRNIAYLPDEQELINGCLKNAENIVSVDSIDDIISQFNSQDMRYDAEEKSRRNEWLSKIDRSKRVYCTNIISDFEQRGLLKEPLLTNEDKIREYSLLKDFCMQYIPELGERGFKMESLCEKYPDFISEETCRLFAENWARINRTHGALSRGADGEEKVYEVLRLFDDRIRILKDYVWGREHDFIVITPYGISTIEVKHLRGNYVLTETGILKCLSSEKVKPKDVALQSKKHLETLRRNLSSCSAFSSEVPLQEIICSAEANFTIKDNYHYIPVCYYNTIDKILLPEGGKEILSTSTMDEIQRYLLENKHENFKFDVFLPRGEIDSREEFIKNFAEVASGYLVANRGTME